MTGRRPGYLLVRVGCVLFVVGVALVVAAFAPALLGGGGEPSGPLAGAALVVPSVGLGMMLSGVVRTARAESRAARERRRAETDRRRGAETAQGG